jgi:low temperature requirement protein LtrA
LTKLCLIVVAAVMSAFASTLVAILVVSVVVLPGSVWSVLRAIRLRRAAPVALGIEGKERQPVMALQLVGAVAAMLTLVVIGGLSDVVDARLVFWGTALAIPWLLLQLGALQVETPS